MQAAAGRAGLPQTRRAAGRPRPLVVLPTLTWQGLNPIDDDFDGFADTLETSRSVKLNRPLVRGELPRGFVTEVAPLLRFLDRTYAAVPAGSERRHVDAALDSLLARG